MYTQAHTKRQRDMKTTLSLLMGYCVRKARQTAQFSSGVAQMVHREMKSSQFGTREAKRKMTARKGVCDVCRDV